jgi:putative MFS transporter
VWGDKFGRISVLFGSILIYSSANIANGFVQSLESYALLRFIAGVGLAGELGAGITLVAETLPKQMRGVGTTIVATIGVAGGVTAGIVGDMLHWRTAYFVGGGMGLCLLVLRIIVHESGLYKKSADTHVRRGDFLMLFATRERFFRFLACVLTGLPIWFVVGVLLTFAPEFGRELAISEVPKAGSAILYGYIGFVLGDVASGGVSQILKSRKKALFIFLTITALGIATMLSLKGASIEVYYAACGFVGFGAGYWAVFVTTAAEQFGTNMRATVTTTVPNFIRGTTVPITMSFQALKPTTGIISSAAIVGSTCLLIAFFAIRSLSESFHRDMDFYEH